MMILTKIVSFNLKFFKILSKFRVASPPNPLLFFSNKLFHQYIKLQIAPLCFFFVIFLLWYSLILWLLKSLTRRNIFKKQLFFEIFEWNSTQILEIFKLSKPYELASMHGRSKIRTTPPPPPPSEKILATPLMIYTLILRNKLIFEIYFIFGWNLAQFL